MTVNTTLGPLGEEMLTKHEGVVDNENEKTISVEYCLNGCKGPAHITGQADSESYFCSQHVHRSVHVTLKRAVRANSAVGSIGG